MKARTSLKAWCVSAGYVPAQHHELILEALADVAAGTDDRVMIFMPPGSAKSTYGSILFPPWYMCQFPGHNVMACSHTMALAERFGGQCRNMVIAHPDELGLRVSDDSSAKGRWALAPYQDDDGVIRLGGEFMAAGVDTGIAGFRSDLTVIDDPVKSRQDAESETKRQGVKDWWTFDVQPRLKPGGKVVIIMTRWNEDDLAGWLLSTEGEKGKDPGGRWRVISLPMEAEDDDDILGRAKGERLWSEWFTDEMVQTAKKDIRLWSALYQQRPTAEEGNYWKKHWLRPVPPGQVPPRNVMRLVGGSDYATKKDGGDFTVHAVVGLDPEDRPWLLDLWRKQTTSDWWVSAWCDLVIDWKPTDWAEERGQIINGVGPWLEREQRKRKAYTNRVQFTPNTDKGTAAQAFRGMVATQGLWYSEELRHRAEMEAELLSFPATKHDDIHDALGKVGMLLATAVKGQEPKKPNAAQVSGYKTTRPMGAGGSMKVL